MIESEGKIQEGLNEAGCIATREAVKHLDTDGSMGEKMWRTKGQQEKAYQTAYGEVVVERHVYQSVFEKLSEASKEDLNHADIEKSLRSFR